jgi:kynureninase
MEIHSVFYQKILSMILITQSKKDWGNNLISSWNDKWIELPNKVSKKIASILNCNGNEVYVGSSTSNNLYKLIKSILEGS